MEKMNWASWAGWIAAIVLGGMLGRVWNGTRGKRLREMNKRADQVNERNEYLQRHNTELSKLNVNLSHEVEQLRQLNNAQKLELNAVREANRQLSEIVERQGVTLAEQGKRIEDLVGRVIRLESELGRNPSFPV